MNCAKTFTLVSTVLLHTLVLGQLLADESSGQDLSGIGAQITKSENGARIERIIAGGGAAEAKLQIGDVVIGVSQDGNEFADTVQLQLRNIIDLIRGRDGTPVFLRIKRGGKKEVIKVTRRKLMIQRPMVKGDGLFAQNARRQQERLIPLFEEPDPEKKREWVRKKMGEFPEMLLFTLSNFIVYAQKDADQLRWAEFIELQRVAAVAYDESNADKDGAFFQLKEEVTGESLVSRARLQWLSGKPNAAIGLLESALNSVRIAKKRRESDGLPRQRKIDELTGMPPEANEVSTLEQLARMHRIVENDEVADDYLLEAYQIMKSSESDQFYARARRHEIEQLIEKGSQNPEQQRESYERALALTEKVIQRIFVPPKTLESPLTLAVTTDVEFYRTAAMVAGRLDKHELANKYIDQAIAWDLRRKQVEDVVKNYGIKAALNASSQKWNVAAEQYKLAAVEALKSGLKVDQILGAFDAGRWHVAKAHVLRMQSKAEENDSRLRLLLNAKQEFLTAFKAFDVHRDNLRGQVSKGDPSNVSEHLLFSWRLAGPIAEFVEVCFELKQVTGLDSHSYDALTAVEQNSARWFRESSTVLRERWSDAMPPIQWRNCQREQERLSRLKVRLVSATNQKERTEFEAELKKQFANYQQMVTGICQQYPAARRYFSPGTVSIYEDCLRIPGNTRVLRYFFTKEKTYTWVIGPDEIHFHESGVSEERLERMVNDYVGFYTESGEKKHGLIRRAVDHTIHPNFENLEQEFEQLSNRLYRALVQGVESQLPENATIVIAPDQCLHNLPFATLLRDDATFLIESHPIVTALSLTTYTDNVLLNTEKTRRGRPWYLGVSVAEVGEFKELNKSAISAIGTGRVPQNSANLSVAVDSVKKNADLFEEHLLLLNTDATESALRNRYLTDFDFVHLSVHGYGAGMRENGNPFLLLHPEDETSPTRDGIFTIDDLQTTKLNCYLTTLSACRSNRGFEFRGEGPQSMAVAALKAGSENVMSTLWNIEVNSTAEFVYDFHRLVLSGQPPAKALQKTMIDRLNRDTVEIETLADTSGEPGAGNIVTADIDFGNPGPAKQTGDVERLPRKKIKVSGRLPYVWGGFVVAGSNLPFITPKETSGPLGEKASPIRCSQARGERAFLDRLVGPDGGDVSFKRLGSVGKGVYGNIVDLYEVTSENDKYKVEILMDMYHPGHDERRAPKGFKLRTHRPQE